MLEQDNYAGAADSPLFVDKITGESLPHLRDASYTFDDYFREYRTYADAFVAAGMPVGRLQGGTWAGSTWWSDLPRYLNEYGDEMNLMGLHQYVPFRLLEDRLIQYTTPYTNPVFIMLERLSLESSSHRPIRQRP